MRPSGEICIFKTPDLVAIVYSLLSNFPNEFKSENVAMVACPHSGTSSVGVKYSKQKSACFDWVTKAVSE